MFGESSVHFEEGWDDAVVTGTPLGDPPLIEMVSSDPVLKGTRLIAEAWNAGGLYQVCAATRLLLWCISSLRCCMSCHIQPRTHDRFRWLCSCAPEDCFLSKYKAC